MNQEVAARAEKVALELAGYAIETMRRRRPSAKERSTKSGPADWVTVVDVEIERHVRARLGESFPGHLVVGEELGGEAETGRCVWYVDPIDGTTNFVHGLPGSTFSLALADDGGLVVGVVAEPHGGEVYRARRGEGARLDGRVIVCTDSTELMGGIVTTELAGVEPWPGLFNLMGDLARRGCVTRIMGSSALALAAVGAGRAAAAVLGGHNPIDVAAGVLVAREAGAAILGGPSVARLLGADLAFGVPLLVAAAPGVARVMQALVTEG